MTLTQLFEAKYLPHARRKLKPRTVAEYERLARALVLPKFGARAVDTITLGEIEDWHETMVDAPVQANRALAVLSAILTYAGRRRLVGANAARGIKRNREVGREFFYTPEQTKALLAAASAWDDIRAKYLALELLTGVRPGELLDSGPTWRHGAVLRTLDGKTGARTIFLSDAACAILEALPRRRDGRYFPPGMSLRRSWERLCKLAGVPCARLYDLRHTFASNALGAGVPLDVIGRMLGHRKVQTTLRYAHLDPAVGLEGAAAAAERMGAGLNGTL
jgi:integrase